MTQSAMGQAPAQKAVHRNREPREINARRCQQTNDPPGPADAPLDQPDKTNRPHGQCRAQHPVGEHDTVFAGRHRTGMCPSENPRCDAAQCHVSRLPPDALRQIVELVVAPEETRHDEVEETSMSYLRHSLTALDWHRLMT